MAQYLQGRILRNLIVDTFHNLFSVQGLTLLLNNNASRLSLCFGLRSTLQCNVHSEVRL